MLNLDKSNKITPLEYATALHAFRGKLGSDEAYGYLSGGDFNRLKVVTGEIELGVVFRKAPKRQLVFAVLLSVELDY